MLRVNLNAWPSCVKCLILLIFLSNFCSCVSLRPIPKVSRCLTDVERQTADCINGSGTEYKLKFTDKGSGKPRDHGFDKMVCMPGDQFIDSVAWVQELLVVLGKGAKK